jgi:membrane carboxypeptidase/penicillin-binding protein PbpC
VEAASQEYFGHSARRLSLEEAAALAATLPFPLSSNPELRPGRMRARQALILRWLRGERIEIPPVLDRVETLLDSLKPKLDSLLRPRLDSLRPPPDTIGDTLRLKPDTIIDTVQTSKADAE